VLTVGAGISGSGAVGVTTADFNGDGRADLVYTSGSAVLVILGADTTPPLAPAITSPASDGSATSPNPTISWTPAESGGTFLCKLDSAASTPCGATSTSISYSGLINGSAHTFKVHQIDSSGNAGPDAVRAFTIDAVGPAAPTITSPASDGS